jgi:hypothetical protein
MERDISGSFAEHGKWVRIGCETWQDFGTNETSIKLISVTYDHF